MLVVNREGYLSNAGFACSAEEASCILYHGGVNVLPMSMSMYMLMGHLMDI